MGALILGILAILAIGWVYNLLADLLPEFCLVCYRFSGSLLLLFGYLCWISTDYNSGKGGEVFLQILLLAPFFLIFMAKLANHNAGPKGASKAPNRGPMLSQSGTFFPIGMLARRMAKLQADEQAKYKSE